MDQRRMRWGLATMGLAAACWLSAGTAADAQGTAKPVVVLETNLGVIEIELDAEKAPVTAANFLKYVDAKFYDGKIFHRVIPNFMAQGGGFDENLRERPTGSGIANESSNGLKNDRGTIAMARTSDPNSATAQFFINYKNNDFLNGQAGRPGYAVFGKVIKGMEVVDEMAKIPTGPRGMFESDVPQKTIVIKSARRK